MGRNVKAGDAYVILGVQDKTSKDMAKIAGDFEELGGQMASMASTGLAIFGATVGAIAVSANEAGKLDAALQRINLTYASLADSQLKWMETFRTATQRGMRQTAEMAATFGAFTKGLGFTNEHAQELAQGLMRVSSNMATFAGISIEESAQRFRSAMAGSSEVLDMLGINIKEAALNAKLLELGFTTISNGATEQQKVLARYVIVLDAMEKQGSNVADQVMWTLPRALDVAKGAFSDFLIAAGKPFLDLILQLATLVISFTKGISYLVLKYPTFTRVVGISVLGLTSLSVALAAVGFGITIFSKLLMGASGIVALYNTAIAYSTANNLTYAASFLTMSRSAGVIGVFLTIGGVIAYVTGNIYESITGIKLLDRQIKNLITGITTGTAEERIGRFLKQLFHVGWGILFQNLHMIESVIKDLFLRAPEYLIKAIGDMISEVQIGLLALIDTIFKDNPFAKWLQSIQGVSRAIYEVSQHVTNIAEDTKWMTDIVGEALTKTLSPGEGLTGTILKYMKRFSIRQEMEIEESQANDREAAMADLREQAQAMLQDYVTDAGKATKRSGLATILTAERGSLEAARAEIEGRNKTTDLLAQILEETRKQTLLQEQAANSQYDPALQGI